MGINWRSTDEHPENGQSVWCLNIHKAHQFPEGYRIYGGIFEKSHCLNHFRVCTWDGCGEGSWCLEWPGSEGFESSGTIVHKWIPAEELDWRGK